MSNTLITYLQIFGIGLSFGIAGPCFLTCTPVLITYIAGSKKAWGEVFKDILVFLSGRLLAYVLLGALAGLSASLLRKFTGSYLASFFQPLAGAVTILFAVILLTNRLPENRHCEKGSDPCPPRHCEGALAPEAISLFNFGGVFAFGFLIGSSPCAPLLALLFDITLMSKGVFDGMLYALSFGLGTFISGFITVGLIAGILTRVPAVFIKSKAANMVFRIVCALLLIALGAGLILK